MGLNDEKDISAFQGMKAIGIAVVSDAKKAVSLKTVQK